MAAACDRAVAWLEAQGGFEVRCLLGWACVVGLDVGMCVYVCICVCVVEWDVGMCGWIGSADSHPSIAAHENPTIPVFVFFVFLVFVFSCFFVFFFLVFSCCCWIFFVFCFKARQHAHYFVMCQVAFGACPDWRDSVETFDVLRAHSFATM